MSETMENATATETAENQTAETMTETPEHEEKLFTQKEVDFMIKKRLERATRNAGKENGTQMQELAKRKEVFNQRLADLETRENTLKCKEFLIEHSLPAELTDVIDTANADDFIKKVNIMYNAGMLERSKIAPQASTELNANGNNTHDPFKSRKHMKHKPKKNY